MGKKILLIEDDDLVRATLKSALESTNYVVTEAADGEEGLKQFHAFSPDLVVTDILMPKKEGIETILALRRISPTLKILAMSGGDRVGNLEFLSMAEKLGADRTLQKPFWPRDFLREVEELLTEVL